MTSTQFSSDQLFTHNLFKHRIFLSFMVIVISALALTNMADDYAEQQLNHSMVAAGVSFATARTLDAGISLVKSTEVSAGVASVKVGALLSPISDLIDKFCWVMTLAFGSLALQKILVTILASSLANSVLILSSLAMLITLWHKRAQPNVGHVFAVFKVVVLVRFLLVVTVSLNLAVDAFFLEEHTQESSNQIQVVASTVDFLGDASETNASHLNGDEVEQSYFEAMKQKWDSVSNGVTNQKEKILNIKQDVETSIAGFINLMVLFILKTVLLPLLFLYALKNLFLTLFRVENLAK
ncbi:hypothetical protein [Vibrio tapetis]|uniref:Uncharacterized protein n=1 Tax=Vibrio tapetis subsp. tapetis TaxID=1671868 RepID=A0A2N8ZLA9_9VIBR|nr:hypothetical protein [Vibrio tapetis]SON52690.1 conserved membrane protein of unknown function [Vibrio tapetis subsp. tapetis]